METKRPTEKSLPTDGMRITFEASGHTWTIRRRNFKAFVLVCSDRTIQARVFRSVAEAVRQAETMR